MYVDVALCQLPIQFQCPPVAIVLFSCTVRFAPQSVDVCHDEHSIFLNKLFINILKKSPFSEKSMDATAI